MRWFVLLEKALRSEALFCWLPGKETAFVAPVYSVAQPRNLSTYQLFNFLTTPSPSQACGLLEPGWMQAESFLLFLKQLVHECIDGGKLFDEGGFGVDPSVGAAQFHRVGNLGCCSCRRVYGSFFCFCRQQEFPGKQRNDVGTGRPDFYHCLGFLAHGLPGLQAA